MTAFLIFISTMVSVARRGPAHRVRLRVQNTLRAHEWFWARMVSGRNDRTREPGRDEIARSELCFRLLRAGTTGRPPVPPLEVGFKSLWQPYERCTRV